MNPDDIQAAMARMLMGTGMGMGGGGGGGSPPPYDSGTTQAGGYGGYNQPTHGGYTQPFDPGDWYSRLPPPTPYDDNWPGYDQLSPPGRGDEGWMGNEIQMMPFGPNPNNYPVPGNFPDNVLHPVNPYMQQWNGG